MLFGRHYPGCAWLARKVAAWEERHQRRDAPTSKDAWEREYDHGDWRFLQGDEEAERYGWLVERIDRRLVPVSVLDVGYGEGVLLARSRPRELQAYTGVDLSEVAISSARESHPKADFVVAAAEDFAPPPTYDLVVFNEIVYYLRDPIGEVERYLQFVAEGGELLLSVFESTRT